MELRVFFAPCLFSLSFDTSSFAGGALSPPKLQQQAAAVSTQYISAVAVAVVALDRSLYFLPHPPPTWLAQLISLPISSRISQLRLRASSPFSGLS